jgi:glycolate oxidase FAD binding subunit
VKKEFELSSQLSAPEIDGMTPSTIEEPETGAEVAAVLADARRSGRGVVPVGGATMVGVGDIPERYDVALSTRKLTGIVEYSPGDLTVVVRGGTTLQELQEELARHGQFVPLQPSSPVRATVGGVLAVSLSGPWRQAYGGARDFTIGMRMALPSGQMAKSGGKVVKNVAGYDLAKLFIGSYGSLGVITEVAFKVYPLPRERLSLMVDCQDVGDAMLVARETAALGPGILGVAALGTPGSGDPSLSWQVMVMVGGTEGTVRDLASTVRSTATKRKISESGDTSALEMLSDQPVMASFHISTVPSRTGTGPADLEIETMVSYPSIGAAYVTAPAMGGAEVRRARQGLAPDGQLRVLHVPSDLRREVGTWGPPGSDFPLMKRVKDVFDPERVMSPGRFVGGL